MILATQIRMGRETGMNSSNDETAKSPFFRGVQDLKGGVRTHREEALATDLARNALTWRRYLILLRVTFGISVTLLISVAVNIHLALRPVETRYFAMDSEGGIRELEVLTRPVQSERLVLNWTTQAVTEAFSMSFANRERQLEQIRPLFTPPGWLGYQQALDESGLGDSLLRNQVVTSAVPRKAPVVVAQGMVGGVFGWRIQLPLLVAFKSASVNHNRELLIDVTVVRRPAAENPIGLGIEKLVSN